MTFSELQTVMFEVANLLNERPIGTKETDPNEGSYLRPNDLILGRASSNVPIGQWDEAENLKQTMEIRTTSNKYFLQKMAP